MRWLPEKPALIRLVQKFLERIAGLIHGNDTVQVVSIAFQGFNRHVGAVYFNQLGGMAYALSGYTNPLVVYRGDSYYGGGFALLAEAWRKTFRPHI